MVQICLHSFHSLHTEYSSARIGGSRTLPGGSTASSVEAREAQWSCQSALHLDFRTLGDEQQAEKLFVQTRWPNGVICPKCGSDKARAKPSRKPQPFRCYACRADFSVKTGTVMQGSKLPLSQWAIAAFLMTTNLKGVSSMKLHRNLASPKRPRGTSVTGSARHCGRTD